MRVVWLVLWWLCDLGAARAAPKLWETPPDAANPVWDAAFSPDGKLLAVSNFHSQYGSSDQAQVRLYDVATHALLRKVDTVAWALAWTRDGKTLITGSWGHGVELRDPATLKVRTTLDPAQEQAIAGVPETSVPGQVSVLAVSRDGKYLAAIWSKGLVTWSLPDGKRLAAEPNLVHQGSGAILFTGDGQLLFSTDGESIQFRRPRDLGVVRALAKGASDGLALGADGGKLVGCYSISSGPPLIVWDARSGVKLGAINWSNSVNAVALSPDGKYLVGVGESMQARAWSMAKLDADGEMLPGHGDAGAMKGTTTVTFSPDGKLVAIGGGDGKIIVFAAPHD